MRQEGFDFTPKLGVLTAGVIQIGPTLIGGGRSIALKKIVLARECSASLIFDWQGVAA
jgi:hypothetical protein